MYGELIQKGKFTFTTRKFYILKHQLNDITLGVCLLCFPILGILAWSHVIFLYEQALPPPQKTSLNIETGKIVVTVLYLLFNGFSVQRRHFTVVIAHAVLVTSAVCRGFQAGSFHVFGAGLAFPDQLMDTETLAKAKAQLSKQGQRTMKT